MVVFIVVAYLVACLAIGMLSGRGASDSAAGYVAGDRTLGLVLMYFITGATIFSAFAFLGAPGWAYSRGVAIFYLFGYGCIGFLPFYFLGPRAAANIALLAVVSRLVKPRRTEDPDFLATARGG